MQPKQTGDQGFALVGVLLMLLVMTLIGVAIMDHSRMQVQSSAAHNRSYKSEAISEGAVQMAASHAQIMHPESNQMASAGSGQFCDTDNPRSPFRPYESPFNKYGYEVPGLSDELGLTNDMKAEMIPWLNYTGNLPPGPGWSLNTPGYAKFTRKFYIAAGVACRQAPSHVSNNGIITATVIEEVPIQYYIRQ